jgi:hypothetical protein
VLSCAGVRRADIVADYALSGQSHASLAASAFPSQHQKPKNLLGAPPEAMEGLLDHIEQTYGSVSRLKLCIGLLAHSLQVLGADWVLGT